MSGRFINFIKLGAFVKHLDYKVVRLYTVRMSDEMKTQRVTIMMTPSELKQIDDWSFAQRIRSRGEAIRQLIEFTLHWKALEGDDKAPYDPGPAPKQS